MQPRTLLILASIVATLVAGIWFWERDLPSSEERAALARRVVSIDAESVERVRVTRAGETLVLRREEALGAADDEAPAASRWVLEEPLRARADGVAVDGFVRRLVELEKERTLEDVTRADVGLAEPRARVELVTSEGDAVLEIGADVPAASTMTLALAGGEEIHVVSNAIWADLEKAPGEWRDRELIRAGRDEVERVTLDTGKRLLLARRGEAFWVESPFVDRAERQMVDALLTELTGLRAESFVDDPAAAAAGFATSAGSLEIVLDGQEAPRVLEIGGEGADDAPADDGKSVRYVRLDGQVATVRTGLATDLERQALDWRSLDWSASEVYRIDGAVIEDASGRVELRREDGDWLRDDEPIAFGDATDLLYGITGARAERIVDVLPTGEAALTVTLEGEGMEPETVWLYPPRDGEVPARVSGREIGLWLSTETADGVRAAVEALRRAAIVGADAEADPGTAAPQAGPAASDDGGA